jgi:hypothetical protein
MKLIEMIYIVRKIYAKGDINYVNKTKENINWVKS